MKLPKNRSAYAVALTTFVIGASMPLFAAYALSGEPRAEADASSTQRAAMSATPRETAQASAVAPAASTPTAEVNEQNHDSIVAIVNDEPVSAYELRQRMALMISTMNIPDTPEMRKKVHDQVLEQLKPRSFISRKPGATTSPCRRSKSTRTSRAS